MKNECTFLLSKPFKAIIRTEAVEHFYATRTQKLLKNEFTYVAIIVSLEGFLNLTRFTVSTTITTGVIIEELSMPESVPGLRKIAEIIRQRPGGLARISLRNVRDTSTGLRK